MTLMYGSLPLINAPPILASAGALHRRRHSQAPDRLKISAASTR
jgi:hypothetical protein